MMMFKLEIELVPSKLWFANVRKIVDRNVWDVIRKKTYRRYGGECGICSVKGLLHCHEIWEYDDTHYIQKLKGFIALCPMCHHVKHIGFAEVLNDQGKLDIEDVIRHFMKVNKCTRSEFEKHKRVAFSIWDRRSDPLFEWSVDFNGFIDEVDTIKIEDEFKRSMTHYLKRLNIKEYGI